MGNIRRLFSAPSWPGWIQLLYKAIDLWGNADFLRGKMSAIHDGITSGWAVLVALVWLFGIALGGHTWLLSILRSKGIFRPAEKWWPSRDNFENETGGIDAELDSVKEAWAAFEIGHYYVGMHESRQKKIKRMILLNPETDLVRNWTQEDGSTKRANEDIREASTKAVAHQNCVRWSHMPIINAVFGDPNSKDAWVRINNQLPGVQAANWPSVKITRAHQRRLYESALASFEALWKRGNPPTR